MKNTNFDFNEFNELLGICRDGFLIPIKTNVSYPPTFDELNKFSKCGDGVIHVAARRSSIGLLSFLFDLGFSPNAQGNLGYTALHYAAEAGNISNLNFLIENSGDPSILNAFGDNAYDLLPEE